MFTPPSPDDLSATFAAPRPSLTHHGVTVLTQAYRAVGAKLHPSFPRYDATVDHEAAAVRVAELKLVLEDKCQGTALLFGVRICPDFVAEMYARVMLSMGGEHVEVQLGRHAPFLKKAASSFFAERVQHWPGFHRTFCDNGFEHGDEWHVDEVVTLMTNLTRVLHPSRNWKLYNANKVENKVKKGKKDADSSSLRLLRSRRRTRLRLNQRTMRSRTTSSTTTPPSLPKQATPCSVRFAEISWKNQERSTASTRSVGSASPHARNKRSTSTSHKLH